MGADARMTDKAVLYVTSRPAVGFDWNEEARKVRSADAKPLLINNLPRCQATNQAGLHSRSFFSSFSWPCSQPFAYCMHYRRSGRPIGFGIKKLSSASASSHASSIGPGWTVKEPTGRPRSKHARKSRSSHFINDDKARLFRHTA